MKINNYRDVIRKLGKVYFRLAVEWGRGRSVPKTVADAHRLMDTRKDGKKYKTKKARREAAVTLRDVAEEIFWRRRDARKYWENGRRQNRGSRANIFGCSYIAVLPFGSLRKRADKRIRSRVKKWMLSNCPGYSGSTKDAIYFGEPYAETVTSEGERYPNSKYHMTDALHCVTLPRDYWHSVIRRNMIVVDGLLTLSLKPITHDSRTVYAAKWARVSGKRLKMESGYIAVDGDETAHAKTPQAACATLTRRANEARLSRISRRIREKLESMRLNGYAGIEVTLSDSYKAGNCKPGTLAFRDKYFPGRESCTVEELLSVESQRKLAINAALQAIRRQK